MEPNENQLSSYFHHPLHHHHHQLPPPPPLSAPSPTNGLLPSGGSGAGDGGGAHMVYTHSVPSSAAVVVAPTPLEPVKRKRGRPRKYGTPEQALAAKKAATASSHSAAAKEKKEYAGGGGSSPSYSVGSSAKKSQLAALGNARQGFTPHVISVSAGEDVAQKIMMFIQQSKREICILSASGSISNVSLRQPAASGGSVTYEGQFSIISFSGSYVENEVGVRSGGLSVCLASTDGQIIGGGVFGGPLKASGPVQVIVGTFLIDTKKDVKGDGSSGMKLPSPVGITSPSSLGFRSGVESGMRNPIDEQQGIAGGHFMVQPNRPIHVTTSRPTEWRPGPDARPTSAYDLTGRAGLSAHHSPENGDYDQIPD